MWQLYQEMGPFFLDQVINLARKDNPLYPVLLEKVSVFEDADGDKDLCSLTALISMLHSITSKRKGEDHRCSRLEVLKYLVQNVPEGTNGQGVADRKDTTFRYHLQPAIHSIGRSGEVALSVFPGAG